MRRIVRGALLGAGAALAVTGCGAHAQAPPRAPATTAAAAPTPDLAAAVLAQRDLPAGFLPAEAQPAFQGVVPADPDCRGLLALADGQGFEGVPRAAAAFYQVAPGATVSQQVLAAGAERAEAALERARTDLAACPVLEATVGGTPMTLHRVPLPAPGLPPEQTVAVRYLQKASENYRISYEIVMVRVDGTLLLVGQPGIVHKRAPSTALRAALAATARLAGPARLAASPKLPS